MIEFRKLDRNNFYECINMRLKGDQTRFIDNITMYISLAYVIEEYEPLLIYYKEEMVGFLTLCFNKSEKEYWIDCFFIKESEQSRGYGSWALKKLISIIKEDKSYHIIKISIHQDNFRAMSLLDKLGFYRTDFIENGKIIYELRY